MDGDASFGAWVRRRRRALDVTQAELARRLSCAASTVRAVEADARRPSRELAERLAEHLEIAPGERAAFVRSARSERRLDALGPPDPPRAPGPARGAAAPAVAPLPMPATPLVGREAEAALVQRRLVQPGVRLLTLTGPGGVGKTRLALQVAADLAEARLFLDGVVFVALEAIQDAGLVPAAIGAALGIRAAGGSPAHRLLAALRDRQLLLVLDNLEQVPEAAPLLAELLAAAPRLTLLVTSRAILHLAAEHEFLVPPLRLPDPQRRPTVDELASVESVALFVRRAQAVAPDFALTPANAAAVAAICARLDGLPLAIELAAARVKLFAPAALLGRLARPLTLLTGGARDLPARHRTLRDTLAWSHGLLGPEERALFRRLAVCAGGCTIAAAEALGAEAPGGGGDGLAPTPPHPHAPTPVLDLLGALVDQSLVQRAAAPADEPRVRLLETVREYGLERLAASGEGGAARRRHAAYYLGLAEGAEPWLHGAAQQSWLDRLEAEHDNLRAALGWCLGAGDEEEGGEATPPAGAGEEAGEATPPADDRAALGLRLAGALAWFWYTHGHHGEGRDWLARALAAGAGPPPVRARALIHLGMLGLPLGDYEWATAPLEEGLALSRELGDTLGAARALRELGSAARFRGDYGRAAALLEEGLALFREVGDRWGAAGALEELGVVARVRGDYRWAAAFLEESLALFREMGDQWGAARALHQLGIVARNRGDHERAAGLLEEGLALLRESGDEGGIGWALRELGITARDRGDHERAAAFLEEGLALFREQGNTWGVARALEELGVVARLRGDYGRAAALLEEGLVLLRGLGDKRGIALTCRDLGVVARLRGDHRRATGLLEEGLALCRDLGDKRGIALSLEELAEVAGAHGRPERAARLLGAAMALREGIGAPATPAERAGHDHLVAALRRDLDEQAFAAAWATGQAAPLDQTIAWALEAEAPIPITAGATPARAAGRRAPRR